MIAVLGCSDLRLLEEVEELEEVGDLAFTYDFGA